MLKVGMQVAMGYVLGYEAYFGIKGRITHKKDCLYWVRFNEEIEGDTDFILSEEELLVAENV